jgi:hypothetical protein
LNRAADDRFADDVARSLAAVALSRNTDQVTMMLAMWWV